MDLCTLRAMRDWLYLLNKSSFYLDKPQKVCTFTETNHKDMQTIDTRRSMPVFHNQPHKHPVGLEEA